MASPGQSHSPVIIKNEEEEFKIIKSLVSTFLHRCKLEADNKSLHIPIEDYEDRVAYYTDLSKTYIQQIQKECTPNSKTAFMSLFDRMTIFKCFRDFYAQNKSPTYSDVYESLMVHPKSTDFAQFKQEMISLGYEYRKTANGRILMEDPEITFERFFYLSNMRKMRQKNMNIYYIDERIIDKSVTFKKPWIENIDISSDNFDGLIFLHVVSGNRFVNGLFCNQVTEEDFNKWVCDILLGILRPSSVIVMDNSPLHGTIKNKSISKYDSKYNMLKWLKGKNIPCNDSMSKAELYELIRKCGKTDVEYQIDSILLAHGHMVLRLPFKFHDLSPTDLMWKYVIPEGGVTNTMSLGELKDKILTMFSTTGTKKWIYMEKEIEKHENEIIAIDKVIEIYLDEHLCKD